MEVYDAIRDLNRNGNRAREISGNIYICWGVPRFLYLYLYLCFSTYTPHWPLILISVPHFFGILSISESFFLLAIVFILDNLPPLSLLSQISTPMFFYLLFFFIWYPLYLIESSLSDILIKSALFSFYLRYFSFFFHLSSHLHLNLSYALHLRKLLYFLPISDIYSSLFLLQLSLLFSSLLHNPSNSANQLVNPFK